MTTKISKTETPRKDSEGEVQDPKDVIIANLFKTIAVVLLSNNQTKQLANGFLEGKQHLTEMDFVTFASEVITKTRETEKILELMLTKIMEDGSSPIITEALNGQSNAIIEALRGEINIGN